MRIGRHMPTRSKLLKTVEIAREIGCEAMQIFASNPAGWSPPVYDPVEDEAFALAARAADLDPLVIHAPYLINLGSPEELIWEKSIALLTWTLRRGAGLGVKYVVFHTGSHRGSGVEAGIARIAQGITRVLQEAPPEVMLLLENDVGAGKSLGGNFAQLAAVLCLLPAHQERLGVCLDTAHLWGAGYDISGPEAAARVIGRFAEEVGMARLQVLHLNDTEKALGSHRDVHARLGEGIIGETGLHALLSDPRLGHVAVLMETPIKTDENGKEDWVHDAGQIALAKRLSGRSVEID
jgi:deoxyribonuclease-4